MPAPRPSPVTGRLPLIDALKAIASQLIVLHHLAFYGPMSDTVRPHARALVDGLAEHGRLAVQVFLVVAGFLAARTLAPGGVAGAGAPGAAIARRWARLAGPYVAAIALAIATAAIGRTLVDPPTVPEAPTVRQVLANLAMLQDLVGESALSAGLWYVSIDLQLFAIAAVLAWSCARLGTPGAMPIAVVALAAASLLGFNRHAGWDATGLYFFGSYALGMLAAWAGPGRLGRLAPLAIAVLGGVALWVEFRSRIAVALATALLLAWAVPRGAGERLLAGPATAFLARISYSVFLVHYPVCVLVEAVAARWFADDATASALGLAVAWAASVAAGALLHRWVESPINGALSRRRPPTAPPRTDPDTDGAPAGPPGPPARQVALRRR